MLYDNKLRLFKSKFCCHIEDNGIEVTHIQNPFVLSQAIGYAKYKAGLINKHVVFRGQRTLYNGRLIPSLYRKAENSRQIEAWGSKLNIFKKNVYADLHANEKEKMHIDACEPMLQHYGINTRWIDLVDNLWIALWFASYKPYVGDRVKKHQNQYVKWVARNDDFLYRDPEDAYETDKIDVAASHFENGGSKMDILGCDTNDTENPKYAYLLLLEAGTKSIPDKPGFWIDEDKQSELIDLRIACPSLFLRPHNQHALLLRRYVQSANDLATYEYFNQYVTGVIRICVQDALTWLGDGLLTKPEFLFPSPFSDFMYRHLLEYQPKQGIILGNIVRYWQ